MRLHCVIKKTITLLFLFIAFISNGQQSNRQFSSIKVLGENIEIQVSDGKYLIAPLNDFTIHTIFYPSGKALKNFSFATDMKAERVDFMLVEEGNNITVKSKGINLRISKAPFKIAYYYNNKLLICENRGYTGTDSLEFLNFSIEKEEVLYGGGARALGMNRRGNRLQLYNRAHYGYETRSGLMNYTLPLFLSSKQYAVLFDNASSGFLDLDSHQNNEITYETVSGTPNYYVIAGDNWYHLVQQYTRLTGRQPLPPRWAFGNFSSRFGYHSQAETEATVEKFFKTNIPLDAVIIDIYWFGKEIKGTMGNLEWFTDSFPKPAQMIKKFNKKGIKTILVTEPFILTTSKRWQEAVENQILATDGKGNPYTYDFYFGNTGLIDIYDPKARAWFWNIYRKLTDQGIGGWWGDLGEPEVHPSGLQHINGSADELHNSYGHEWSRLIYEGYRQDFPDIRPFILMRAGYAGSQRYGIIPWTGDVNRSWGGLVPQPEISLQMGMQGLAYMHSDLGGFAGGDTINNELYTRWLQYGVYQPVYRPHAQEHIPAEPVFQNEITMARAKKSIELRYKLMPYIYNMAFENNQTGKPLMIPLFFNESSYKELLTYDKAYMWGDAFLVSPVKEPGLTEQSVYLPGGSQWTNFNTGEIFAGGAEITVPLTIENIPVFVKGGSFIPMTQKAVSSTDYSLETFDLHFYSDTTVKNSHYKLYNDDGESPFAFEKGDYELFEFTAEEKGKSLCLNLSKPKDNGFFGYPANHITLKVHNLLSKPAGIKVGSSYASPKDWVWNNQDKLLEITIRCSASVEKIDIIKELY
ncbi:MAG: TIM-barrel domain-containing protein [Bacteroidota bacterium]